MRLLGCFVGTFLVAVWVNDCGGDSTASDGGALDDCGAIALCIDPVKVDARVPLDASAAEGLSLALCRNGTCSSGTLQGGVAKLGGAFDVAVKATSSADGSTTDIVFTPAFDGYSMTTTDVKDGDQYEVRVTQGAAVILDNTRTIDFVHGTAGCRDGFCYFASYTVTPNSASNIECHTETCPTVAMQIDAAFKSTDLSTPIEAVFCRNAVCETGTRKLFSTPYTVAGLAISANTGTVSGFGVIDVETGADVSSGYTLTIENLSFEMTPLQDGDTYSLKVTQGTTTLVDWSGSVTYDKTFPNGPQCDVTPCLSRKITL